MALTKRLVSLATDSFRGGERVELPDVGWVTFRYAVSEETGRLGKIYYSPSEGSTYIYSKVVPLTTPFRMKVES